MAMNYASKYSDKVDEKLRLASITERAINREYDFTGVNTVNVYSVPTAPMNDYNMAGGNSRYGTASELGNAVQTLVLAQDRSFTFTIDRRNYTDSQMTLESGKALARQINEVVVPEVDAYRISKIVAGAGKIASGTDITKTNAYESFLEGTSHLLDKKVPLGGLVAYVSSKFYKAIRQDTSFIKASDIGQDMLIKGSVGMVEGVQLIHAPSTYLPAGVEFVICSQIATTGAEKLADYKVHDNPPGINGWLVEGRIYYDAFVLDNKKDAIYVHKSTI